MTRSIVEEWGLLVKWPSKNDAHRWRRSDDRRTMRPTGRGEYGNNRVQEIVSGTPTPFSTHISHGFCHGCSTKQVTV